MMVMGGSLNGGGIDFWTWSRWGKAANPLRYLAALQKLAHCDRFLAHLLYSLIYGVV